MVLTLCFRYTAVHSRTLLCIRTLSYVGTTEYKFMIVAGFWLVLALMLALYGTIFSVARRHINQIHTNPKAFDSVNGTRQAQKSRKLNAEIKIAKICGTVFGIFFLSYIPSTILATIPQLFAVDRSSLILLVGRIVTTRLIYVNSITNPITYAWKNKVFRTALYCLLTNNSFDVSDTN